MRRTTYILLSVFLMGVAGLAFAQPAQEPVAESPESVRLLFREDFKGQQPNDVASRIPLAYSGPS